MALLPIDDELLAGHVQELRRGTVVVACLAALRTERYGYRLLEDLAAVGITVTADTLYPLLRRLEAQGLLRADWNTDESRPRKFYATTPQGEAVLAALVGEWRALDAALQAITSPAPSSASPSDPSPNPRPGSTSGGAP